MFLLIIDGKETTGGNGNGAPCKLPFIYHQTTYNECIDAYNQGQFWCPTADLNGTTYVPKTTKWGNCQGQ